MGPLPHDAPRAPISEDNPAGTDGFELVEFAHPDPEALEALFARIGYKPVAHHREKAITIWRQGDITWILNAEKGSFADRFVTTHGPCAPSMTGASQTPKRRSPMQSQNARRNTPATTRRSMSRQSPASAKPPGKCGRRCLRRSAGRQRWHGNEQHKKVTGPKARQKAAGVIHR